MRIEKLPSGSYRVRKTVDGVNVAVVFDRYPNEFEIMESVTSKVHVKKSRPSKQITLRKAIEMYTQLKDLAVSTDREYRRLPNRISDDILDTPINEIDQQLIDLEISRLKNKGKSGKKLKAKTIYNYMTEVQTVIKKYCPSADFNLDECPCDPPTLDEPYIPTRDVVKKLLDYVNKNDVMFYIPMALAAFCGLRREEIIALKPSDIGEDYQIRIESAIVDDFDGNWVEKSTKTPLSTRFVPIPKQLAERIWLQGYVYHGHPHSINKALHRVQKEMGIQEFDLHKFRHYFATELADANVAEADILYLGGWSKNSRVLQKIYRHSRAKQDKDRRTEIMNKVTASFYTDVMTNCHNPAPGK